MASSFSRWLTWRQAAGYGLLLLPLLAGLVLPETALSGDIAAKKGMNLSSGALIDAQRDEAADDAVSTDEASPEKSGKAGSTKDSAKGATTIDELIKGIPGPDGTMIYGGGAGVPAFVSYGDYDREFAIFSTIIYKQPVIRIDTASFTEYLTALDLYRKQFRGKKVEITGFVYRTESMAKNQFVVGRLAVQCCSADAVPYGVLAKFGGAGRFADNSWLRVKGVVDETKFDGETVLQLRVEEAASVPQPSNQYVYPNYDFLDDAK